MEGKTKRDEVKDWLLENPDEAGKVLREIAEEREKQALREKIASLEKEIKSQAISFGKKLARLEKEKRALKVAEPEAHPPTLSERLESARPEEEEA